MDIELTKYVRGAGWASKIGPGDLANILCGIEIPADSNVLVGIEGFEDAGVYKITDDIALVQTIDFFTPIVNDPYWFGQIAAANALSDIYAMGAQPRTALNMVCFSPKKYGIPVLKEILRGGIDKIREAGVSLLGGHSVDDEEIKYGLSVTGTVHPDHIVANEGALPGDFLVLTKPLGTGILNTAIKVNLLPQSSIERLIGVMASLNKKGAEAMIAAGVHAATDVTGFGLAGHLKEMIKENVGVELWPSQIPRFDEAEALAAQGMMPGGLHRNREFYKEHVAGRTEGFVFDLLFDPQTSGGLLGAIGDKDMPQFQSRARESGLGYWVIGRFTDGHKGTIILADEPV